jgi:thioredoxin reductase (NADPH)
MIAKKLLVLLACTHILAAKSPYFDTSILKNKKNIVPLAIIGSGPTGLSAALYGARAGIPTFVFVGPKPGGQIIDTRSIENWPGVPKMSGRAAMDQLTTQAKSFGAHIIPKTIIKVNFSKWPFLLTTQDGEQIEALSVIVATGAYPRKLGVKGENVYWNKGVLACALCDAPLSKGQQTVVIGDDDVAIERVLQLAPYASSIELLVPGEHMYASYYMQQKLAELPQVHISYNTKVKKILGNGKRVTDILLKNSLTNKESVFKTSWVYLSVGFDPNTELFKHSLKLTKKGYIKVDHETQTTSVPGVFAAGSVATDTKQNQVGIVTAQGIKAALNAIDLLRKWGVDSKLKTVISKALYTPHIAQDADEKKIYIHNHDEFKQKVLTAKDSVLTFMFDPACSHCSQVKPGIIELAYEYSGKIYLVDTSNMPDILSTYKISSVPSYLIFHNGTERARLSGPLSKKKTIQFFKKNGL